MDRNLIYKKEFIQRITPIVENEKIKRMDQYIQHGNASTLEHCVAVAYISFIVAKRFHIRCDYNSLIRGALLHDYFLYDWHVADDSHKWHGFHHAKKALHNACRDFELNNIEKDIIVKHMFPLNIKPPRYRESFIVMLADKYCSLYEVFKKVPCFLAK